MDYVHLQWPNPASWGVERDVTSTCRVGCDLVAVAEVRASLERFAERYLRRVYTAQEVRSCSGTPPGLAARFAAKEAVVKVLRPADVTLPWPSIEVQRQAGGWCTIALTGAAATLAAQQGLCGFDVSLSHERDYAMAVVHAQSEREG